MQWNSIPSLSMGDFHVESLLLWLANTMTRHRSSSSYKSVVPLLSEQSCVALQSEPLMLEIGELLLNALHNAS